MSIHPIDIDKNATFLDLADELLAVRVMWPPAPVHHHAL